MKGVKYTINFQTLDKGTLNYEDKTMAECIDLIKVLCKEHYDLDIKTSKHIIYNLVHRNTCNKFLKKLCIVSKME